jgi:hypothetical protein
MDEKRVFEEKASAQGVSVAFLREEVPVDPMAVRSSGRKTKPSVTDPNEREKRDEERERQQKQVPVTMHLGPSTW